MNDVEVRQVENFYGLGKLGFVCPVAVQRTVREGV